MHLPILACENTLGPGAKKAALFAGYYLSKLFCHWM